MKERAETDWARVDALADEVIDTSGVPPLDEEFFARARLRMPDGSNAVTLPLDPETYTWFKSLGTKSEERICANTSQVSLAPLS